MTDGEQTPFGAVFAQLAERDPERPAVTDAERTISRRALDERTNRLARVFAGMGVRANSLVTIGVPNSIQFVESALAAWKLGATPQPVSFRLPPPELDAVLELADSSLVVGVGAASGRPHLPAGFEVGEEESADPLPRAIAASWKAPTSGGSTGRPKLIMATTPAVAELVNVQAEQFRFIPDGVHLATGPLYHNGPFAFGMRAMLLGCHLVVMRRFDPEEALALIARHRVDWMYAVPTMMSRIWKLPLERRHAYDLSSLRTVLHLAAPCPPWLKRAWIDWLGADRVWELFATTEAHGCTIIGGVEWLLHPGSVGRVVVGELRILDAEGADVPAGVIGELFWRREAGATTYRYVGADARARGEWESQGDMGRMDAEGYLYLADRSGDMILVGGANVYPAEVEAALVEHPGVLTACVVGVPDDDLGSRPHAIVQVVGAHAVEPEHLRTHLLGRLEPHKVPRTYELGTGPVRDEADKVRRGDHQRSAPKGLTSNKAGA